jgi:hypothetical protein
MRSVRLLVSSARGIGAAAVVLLALGAVTVSAQRPKFYQDDPIAREPDSQDASGVKPWRIPLGYDMLLNLFAHPGEVRDVRAMDVNTIDEVPDSSWFTNRILARPVSVDELVRGPIESTGPAPGRMTVVRAKPEGAAPGFVVRDSAGVTWFVQFNTPKNPEAATAAAMIANKLFWALGYWQTENHLATRRMEEFDIDPKARVETPSGRDRQLEMDDLKTILGHADREADASYRMLASRAIPGRVLGGFKYYGTRPDDPNDVIPHEHRRVLRALQVFGAWTNLTDSKAGNTLDTLLTENGKSYVRHYLQDVGSTFGTGALEAHDYDEGFEYIVEGSPAWKRLLTFGIYPRPWQSVPFEEYPAVGRYQGVQFDPDLWKPRIPNTAMRNARADDKFWAARRVMAFTDEMIRAVVKVGQISDPAAEKHLADVIIQRRDKIGLKYYTAINPLVEFRLADNRLSFVNEGLRSGLVAGPAPTYDAAWSRFDNATGTTTPIAATSGSGDGLAAPPGLPADGFVKVDVKAAQHSVEAWLRPVSVYFRRNGGAWTLVGVERLP